MTHPQLAEITAAIAEITAVWRPDETPITNQLGAKIQEVGARLARLLRPFILRPGLSQAMFDELRTTFLELDTAARDYAEMPEYWACVRIYEQLTPALRLAERLFAATLSTYPEWAAVAKPYAEGTDPVARYVVTLVVGYDPDTTTNALADPEQEKQAALFALNRTRDANARSTVWHVYDRHTGLLRRYNQGEFDTNNQGEHAV